MMGIASESSFGDPRLPTPSPLVAGFLHASGHPRPPQRLSFPLGPTIPRPFRCGSGRDTYPTPRQHTTPRGEPGRRWVIPAHRPTRRRGTSDTPEVTHGNHQSPT